jgi:long-chain acyl-CoA synthetase
MESITRLFDFIQYQKEHYPLEDSLAGKEEGKWIKYSTDDYLNFGNKISRALLSLGVQPGDKIGLISNNRPEWNIIDLAILQIGAINVPIYPTISSSEYEFIFNNAEIKYAFVSDEEIYKKVHAIAHKVDTLIEIFSFDKIEKVRKWTELLDLADIAYQEKVEILKSEVKGSDLATLIYTSGTTGVPKGVMLSHDNLVSNVLGSKPRLPLEAKGKALSFLPLCHVYERILSYLYVYVGVSIYYAESIDTISDNLKEVKPEGFSAVPRLLEKIYDKIVLKGTELTGIKKALFFWALELAKKYEPYQANGAWYEFKLKIANKLIFSKWREALGGNVQVVASGSAALQPRLARIFNAAGVPVMEGYGLTETSPVISVNMMADRHFKIGTVGKPIDKVQVRIAEDGEVLCKGPNVMMGYYKNEEKTKEVLTDDGWFHTGDIGEIDSEGFLKITDRKKEMFKTSGGKYVAPQVMENTFKASMFIEQIMVIGENRKHPAALIYPAFGHIKDYYNHKHLSYPGDDAVLEDEVFLKKINKVVDHYNAGFGKWEQIKKFEFIKEPFTIQGGELTPTLKLKRKAILSKYEELINKIYEEGNEQSDT